MALVIIVLVMNIKKTANQTYFKKQSLNRPGLWQKLPSGKISG